MSVNWPLYEKLLGNGLYTDRRSVVIEEAVRSFVTGIVDDPAYQDSALVDGTTTPIIASRKSTLECSIKAAPETDIHIGDMVECFDETWIVVELYIDKVGIINGVMWLCNNVIRFQNRTPAINVRHCVVDDGTYSKKSADPDAYVPTNTYKIYLTIDEATKMLFVDKRLAFGQIYSALGEQILEVYKVIGMDVKSKNFGAGSHLMVLTVQRDVYNATTDSLTDNLCDVFTANGDTVTPVVSGSCSIIGRDVARLGVTRKYIAKFTDVNGAETQAVAIWSLTVPNGVNAMKDGNEVVIEVPLDEALVGETINITLTDSKGLFGTYEKKVQVITVG